MWLLNRYRHFAPILIKIDSTAVGWVRVCGPLTEKESMSFTSRHSGFSLSKLIQLHLGTHSQLVFHPNSYSWGLFVCFFGTSTTVRNHRARGAGFMKLLSALLGKGVTLHLTVRKTRDNETPTRTCQVKGQAYGTLEEFRWKSPARNSKKTSKMFFAYLERCTAL